MGKVLALTKHLTLSYQHDQQNEVLILKAVCFHNGVVDFTGSYFDQMEHILKGWSRKTAEVISKTHSSGTNYFLLCS